MYIVICLTNQTKMNTEEVTISKKEYRALLATVYAAENYFLISTPNGATENLEQKVRAYYEIRVNADKQSI